MAANDEEFEANAFGLPIRQQNSSQEQQAQIELTELNIAIPYNDVQQRGLIPESKLGFVEDKPKRKKKKSGVKKPKSTFIRYPTQCMRVGAI